MTVKAFPLFKGKTELVPMNIGIGDDFGLVKRATKWVLRLNIEYPGCLVER
jgi:hypothetical protein